ncbi:MAG: hypothetical protein HQL49_03880 [Gammaproteobacteria bacterium]|nr:hypothetical protein [Gammaproteobacteria bacterium]
MSSNEISADEVATKFSADELFALATKKREEESEMQRESIKQKIQELRNQQRDLKVEHRRQLAVIIKEIARLSGKKSDGTRGKSNAPRGKSAEVICSYLKSHGEAKISELQEAMQSAGLVTSNVNQQLAYLKSKGIIEIASRGCYRLTAN